ncbi:hypothetical protein [Thiomonas sp. FB-Cd]|uniref:hypothetical protein n=1 Tax=Thiomonas sp. FB-Cd TaxID=1158292 RepID=UPI0004DF9A72|nr:hypothetical protein [Thiomonas sp. FB-Cd]
MGRKKSVTIGVEDALYARYTELGLSARRKALFAMRLALEQAVEQAPENPTRRGAASSHSQSDPSPEPDARSNGQTPDRGQTQVGVAEGVGIRLDEGW